MGELHAMTSMQVSKAVQELDALADTLRMPNTERCGILGLNFDAYRSWYDCDINMAATAAPELVRRLNYALPLMRRMVANTPTIPASRSQNWLRPMANWVF